MKRVLVGVGGLVAFLVVAGVTVLFLRAFDARRLPPLEAWHQPGPDESELWAQDYASFDAFLAAEARHLEAANDAVRPAQTEVFNRYDPASASYPVVEGRNLNASFERRPAGPVRGGALLVHGLTDSPYHLIAVADLLATQGFYVISLRLPGHGTVPGALTQVTWSDWYDAVRFAAGMVQRELADVPDARFLAGGFSTGGALVLRYALDAVVHDAHPAPDGLLLFAPAVGLVDAQAAFSDWHHVLSWTPYFESFRWVDVLPEYDPFKYNSFPKNAGDQVYDLTVANAELISRVAEDEALRAAMPPLYAFQSVVDHTVRTQALVDLFADIGTPDSELMLFDVNRAFEGILAPAAWDQQPGEALRTPGFQARLLVVTNRADSAGFRSGVSVQHIGMRNNELEATPLDADSLAWPDYVYALSHVSLPIAPDDPFYGQDAPLGRLPAKGETGTLLISETNLARLRYNPFFPLIRRRIEHLLADPGVREAASLE